MASKFKVGDKVRFTTLGIDLVQTDAASRGIAPTDTEIESLIGEVIATTWMGYIVHSPYGIVDGDYNNVSHHFAFEWEIELIDEEGAYNDD